MSSLPKDKDMQDLKYTPSMDEQQKNGGRIHEENHDGIGRSKEQQRQQEVDELCKLKEEEKQQKIGMISEKNERMKEQHQHKDVKCTSSKHMSK